MLQPYQHHPLHHVTSHINAVTEAFTRDLTEATPTAAEEHSL